MEKARKAAMPARRGFVTQPEGAIEHQISEVVVRLYLDKFGKGPLQSETSIRGGVILTVLRDVPTPAERSLHADGRSDSVLMTRMLWQRATAELFEQAVGQVVGRRVLVAIRGFELEHDMASETFILAA